MPCGGNIYPIVENKIGNLKHGVGQAFNGSAKHVTGRPPTPPMRLHGWDLQPTTSALKRRSEETVGPFTGTCNCSNSKTGSFPGAPYSTRCLFSAPRNYPFDWTTWSRLPQHDVISPPHGANDIPTRANCLAPRAHRGRRQDGAICWI